MVKVNLTPIGISSLLRGNTKQIIALTLSNTEIHIENNNLSCEAMQQIMTINHLKRLDVGTKCNYLENNRIGCEGAVRIVRSGS
jgi:hypothetical protein